MAKVAADISMSLDGFITGPDDSPEHGLGIGGERLHQWLFDLESWREPHGMTGGKSGTDADVLAETFDRAGAIVLGKRMFDFADGWGEEPPFHMPVFVVTHDAREPLVKQGGTTFAFVNDGIERALDQATAAAGDKDVLVAGGASVIQQVLRAGRLDEIQIHLVPVLFGAGKRLFDRLDPTQIELETTRVIASPGVTHLRFRVAKNQTT
ncbi:MAG TPA: dihydrofolate reductase family protein [Thermomicrobiales bacterium]|jgi:dihydrofolate reductase